MATQAVNDWIVSVGWDDSKVVSGSKKLKSLMQKLSRLDKIEGTASSATVKRQESASRNLERIDKARLRAQQLLFQLKQRGGDAKELTAIQNKLNATKTLAGYNRAILDTQKAILAVRKREAEVVAKTPQKSAGATTGPLDYSRVTLIKPSQVEQQITRLDRLSQKAKESLLKVPAGGSFDSVRERINATVESIQKLQAQYRKVGTTRAFDDLSTDAMRSKHAVEDITREVRSLNVELNKAKASAPKAEQGLSSSVRFTDPVNIQNRIQDLVNLEAKLRGAMRKLPQDAKFDQQRQYIRQAIADIGKLQAAYNKAGTTKAFKSLSTEYRRLGTETQMLVRQTNTFARTMNAQQFAADKLRNSVHNLAASYLSVFAAIEGGRRFMEIGAEFETFDAMMLGVSGTAKQAGEDFAFVSAQALRLGSDLTESTKSFAKFGTAATLSDMNPDSVRQMFTQILEVNRAFGLTKERQGLVFLSMEQMLSKNVVSMEELNFRLAA